MKYLVNLFVIVFVICTNVYSQSADSLLIDKGNDAMSMKDYNKALNYYREYLDKHPQDTRIIVSLGAAYVNQKNYAAALECFDKAIELDSNYARALSSRGACLILFKEYTQAGKDLRKALLLDPEDMMTYNSLATLYAYQGDTASAFV